MDIIDNKKASRFEVTVDGYLSVLNYIIREDALAITHTAVPIELRGKGIAAELTKKAFEFAEAHKLKIIPMCSYVNTFVRRYPEYERML